MNCVNIKIINKNPLIVKQKTNMIEEKVAKNDKITKLREEILCTIQR